MFETLVTRFTWTLVAKSDRATAHRLFAFARTELGSSLSLKLAAAQTPSVERQALYLRHANDEARHARLLQAHAEELLGQKGPLLADAEDIFAARGEVGFLAFVCLAEGRGRLQFELVAKRLRQSGRTATSELLELIARDEMHHERYSRRLLLELLGAEPEARRELARSARWELWRHFRRLGRTTADALFRVSIFGLFPVLWLYGMLLRRSADRTRGFHSR